MKNIHTKVKILDKLIEAIDEEVGHNDTPFSKVLFFGIRFHVLWMNHYSSMKG